MLGVVCAVSPLRALRRADAFVGFYFGGRLDEANLATVLGGYPPAGLSNSCVIRAVMSRAPLRLLAILLGRGTRRPDEPPNTRAAHGARRAARVAAQFLEGTVEEAEFDKFAAEYRTLHAESIKASGESPEYFAEYKIIDVAAELASAPGGMVDRAAVLDFGAGMGYSVPFFARHMPRARVTCLDVSRKSLDLGAAKHGGAADFRHFDGRRIPFAMAHSMSHSRPACSTIFRIPSTWSCWPRSGGCLRPGGNSSFSSTTH